jgi:hypothetical protein
MTDEERAATLRDHVGVSVATIGVAIGLAMSGLTATAVVLGALLALWHGLRGHQVWCAARRRSPT